MGGVLSPEKYFLILDPARQTSSNYGYKVSEKRGYMSRITSEVFGYLKCFAKRLKLLMKYEKVGNGGDGEPHLGNTSFPPIPSNVFLFFFLLLLRGQRECV